MEKVKRIDWRKYTLFQQRVFKLILKIPKGQAWTYSQVAARLGNRKLARAVGNALAKNEDAPYIPCHRVISCDGLGGYSARGGLKRKLWLLEKEGYAH